MKALKLLLCCLISVICLLFVFRKTDLHEVTHLLLLIDYKWIIAATVVCLIKMWITVARWQAFVVSSKSLPATTSFHFYAIGTMINMTLPFRMGDIIRAGQIAKAAQIPNTKALGTIATEHILDFMTLGFLLAAGLLFYSYHWPLQIFPIMVFFFVILSVVFVGAVFLKQNTAIQTRCKSVIKNRLPERFLFIPNMIINFCSGLFQFGGLFNSVKVMGLTAGIWIAQGFWIYTLLCALGMITNYHLGFEAVFVLMVMIAVAVMIPSSPSYIGTFHLMIVLGLTQMGVPKTVSLSYAILAHAHAVVTAIAIGFYSLWKGKIKLAFHFSSNKMPTVAQETT